MNSIQREQSREKRQPATSPGPASSAPHSFPDWGLGTRASIGNEGQVPRRDLFMRWKKCLGFSLAAILGGTIRAQGQSQAPTGVPYAVPFYVQRPADAPYRIVQAPPETPPSPGAPSG